MGHQLSDFRAALVGVVTSPPFWPRAAILVGVAATFTMNLSAGLGYGPGSAVLAALIPAVFVIALESFIAIVRNCSWEWAALAGVVLVPAAGIAGWVSWLHGHQVCLWTHNPDPQAQLIPFLPDLLIVCGTVALVALKVAAKKTPAKTPAKTATQTTQPRPAKAATPARQPRPKTTQGAPKTPPGLSPKVLAHLSPDQIKAEETAALDISGLADLPTERTLADMFFDGNRGAAKRTLARAAAIRSGADLQPAMNGHQNAKEN